MRHVRIAVASLVVVAGLTLGGAYSAWGVTLMPGWPQAAGGLMEASPALGDLDGDGSLEVVIGTTDGRVYAWHHDGTLVSGWPKDVGAQVNSSPALGDLDGDGHPEVVIGDANGKVWAWHSDGSLVAGWPKATGGEVSAAPALGDLDGDGEPEVVVGSYDHWVYAWRHDGTPAPGWPRSTGGAIACSTALADLDGDGAPEVVVGSMDGKVYAWHGDGTLVAGWPVTTLGPISGSLGIGDIDSDGHLEVVAGSHDHKVYAWHRDGTTVVGWPNNTSGAIVSSPAVGDIDGDGRLEVVVSSQDNHVYAWRGDGTAVPGWPQAGTWSISGLASAALGDLDGDGNLEVVIGDDAGIVHAWHGNATVAAGWPLLVGGRVDCSAVLGDIDGDGHVEVLVASTDYHVYAWTSETSSADSLPWPMFQHDAQRTGRYGATPSTLPPRGLAFGSVTPANGDFTTQFTWRIKYWDEANVSPTAVWIDTWSRRRGGPRWRLMAASDPADTDYTDGKWYQLSDYPEDGPQGFRCAANVGGTWLYWPTPAPTYRLGPKVNPVVLSSGYVTPAAGTTATDFSYRVKYWHADNLAPDVVWVGIWNGWQANWYQMWPMDRADTNYRDGKEYAFTRRWLDRYSHAFRFAARRGSDWAYWPGPGAAYQSGPTVTAP